MSRLTKHDDYGYPFDLRQEEPHVIRSEFSKLLGGYGCHFLPNIVEVGVLRDEDHLDGIYQGIMRANNDEVRRAKQEKTIWIRRKVVVWRGCYAITCRVENRYDANRWKPRYQVRPRQEQTLTIYIDDVPIQPRAIYDFASRLPNR